jgi:hypothetical protein
MAMPEEIKVLGKKINCEISEADFILGLKGVEGEYFNFSIWSSSGSLQGYRY